MITGDFVMVVLWYLIVNDISSIRQVNDYWVASWEQCEIVYSLEDNYIEVGELCN